MPVGDLRRACFVRVDDDELGAVAASLFDHGPKVNGVAVDVGSPGDDVASVAKVLGIGAELSAVNRDESVATRCRAYGAVELGGSQAVEEAAVHRTVAEEANGSGVGIGQDGLGAVGVTDLLQARGDGIESFVPGDALKGFGLFSL